MQPKEFEQIKKLVSLVFPDMAEEEPTVPEKEGAQGFVLLYSDCVIKVPRSHWAVQFISREAKMLRKLATIDTGNVSVPKVIEYDTSNNLLVTSRMRGSVLNSQMMSDMTYSQRCDLGRALGSFLATLHALKFHDENTLQGNDLVEEFNAVSDILDEASLWGRAHITNSDIPEIRQYIQEFLMLDEVQCTLHDDISIGNLMYDRETETLSVIDFAGCEMGYRHREFRRMGNFHPEIHDACMYEYNRLSPIKITPLILSASRKAESLRRVFRGNGGLEMEFKPI